MTLTETLRNRSWSQFFVILVYGLSFSSVVLSADLPQEVKSWIESHSQKDTAKQAAMIQFAQDTQVFLSISPEQRTANQGIARQVLGSTACLKEFVSDPKEMMKITSEINRLIMKAPGKPSTENMTSAPRGTSKCRFDVKKFK